MKSKKGKKPSAAKLKQHGKQKMPPAMMMQPPNMLTRPKRGRSRQ